MPRVFRNAFRQFGQRVVRVDSSCLPFMVHEKEFSSRYEAIIWICKNQLGRRNLTPEQKKYLIGKQYEAEKCANGGDRKSPAAKRGAGNGRDLGGGP